MKNLSQEENAAIQSNTWSTVLSFLCMELLGEEIFRFYQKHHFGNHPIKDDETAFDVELLPFEKRFYDLVDAAMIYLKENDYRLPRGQGDEKWNITNALKEMFWAVVKLNHPEFFKMRHAIGIRDNYRIVDIAAPPSRPFVEISPFFPGRK